MRIESADFLRRAYQAVCEAWGAPEHQAKAFARAVLSGDLVGQVAQGIAITQIDAMMVDDNQINLTAEPTLDQDQAGFAVMNGNRALGQYAMTCAMEKAIEKAKDHTIGIVWVYNWHDIGCASAYSRIALEHDMVGMVTINSVPLTAPYGGRDMLMSAAPFSFVCPSAEEFPIVGDMSLCQVYDYHLSMALDSGKRLDGKWLVDPDTGELTDDPAPYVADPEDRASPILAATVFPDPKLFIMNIFSELLTGLLTPGGWTSDKHQYPGREWVNKGIEIKRGGGGFCMAINPANLMPADVFKEKVAEWTRTLKGSRLQAGFDEMRMPGERALREEHRRLRNGIPVRDDHWTAFVQIAEANGIDLEALRSASSASRPQ